MWLYVQTWLPILSISLTAAICFGVASFVMGHQNLVLATSDDSSWSLLNLAGAPFESDPF